MLFTKDADEAEAGWSVNATAVSKACSDRQIPMFIVTATTTAAKKQLPATAAIHYLRCDATVIKTAGRVNPTYFVMKGATVTGKYANADYDNVIRQLQSLK